MKKSSQQVLLRNPGNLLSRRLIPEPLNLRHFRMEETVPFVYAG